MAMNSVITQLTRRGRVRRRPVVCRKCGAAVSYVEPVLREGRLQLSGLEGTVRVRWTGTDELSFEHVHPADCEPQ